MNRHTDTAHGKIEGVKRFFKHTIKRFRSIPLPARIGGGVVLLVLLYIWAFIIPTNVQFSYANKETCIGRVTLAPGLQNQRAGKDGFSVELKDRVSLFGVPLFSRNTCVSPVASPNEGRTKVSVAPFGLPLFSKTYGVNIPAMPKAQIATLKDAEVSAVKPLIIPLSEHDAVHAYTLTQGDKKAGCTPVDKGLSCEMSQLALEPSTPYELILHRGYSNDAPQKLETLQIRTLTAVQLVESSVKNDATVYDKPADFRFVFDRPLESTEVTLKRIDGEPAKIDAEFKVEGSTVIVTPKQAMARNAQHQLVIEQVTGKDGGSLSDPITTAFTLSGGPKVANVSIGGAGVSQSAQVIVTFDQPIKADADIAKLARLTGVNGSVSRASDTSIAFNIAGAPLCAAFSLVVDKGLPSGSNDEISAEAWKFDSRIVCGSSAVIGHSVRGRAITAYTFGSGSSTILFTGGMHGSEPSGMSTMQAWVTYLQSNAHKIPADKKVVIVPNTNPDGIAAGSRNNVNNVNIDRNFPASNWRPDIDTASGMIPTGGGTSAGSEPETQAVMAITRRLRPILEVSFHAQGRLVGANLYGNSTAVGTAYAQTVGYKTMFGTAEEEMGYSITGEYEDWMGQELGIPAILIELPTSSGNYLNSQLTALLNLLK